MRRTTTRSIFDEALLARERRAVPSGCARIATQRIIGVLLPVVRVTTHE
jgi:hypothetical protein